MLCSYNQDSEHKQNHNYKKKIKEIVPEAKWKMWGERPANGIMTTMSSFL